MPRGITGFFFVDVFFVDVLPRCGLVQSLLDLCDLGPAVANIHLSKPSRHGRLPPPTRSRHGRQTTKQRQRRTRPGGARCGIVVSPRPPQPQPCRDHASHHRAASADRAQPRNMRQTCLPPASLQMGSHHLSNRLSIRRFICRQLMPLDTMGSDMSPIGYIGILVICHIGYIGSQTPTTKSF